MTWRTSGAPTRVPGRRLVKALRSVLDLVMLGAITFAFTVEIWIGAVAFLFWYAASPVIPVVVLAPFFGEERVREALWGDRILRPPEDAPGATATEAAAPAGRTGRALTDLDPEGLVEIDGERRQARSSGDTIRSRTEVVVVGARLGALVVEPRRDEGR